MQQPSYVISALSFVVDVTTKLVEPERLSTFDEDSGTSTVDNPELPARELPVALVHCLVDDVEPLTSRSERPFDALHCALYGMLPEDHDLWTCSCGIAGCAGLHDGVEIALTDDHVQWQFPLATYRKKFSEAFVGRFPVPPVPEGTLAEDDKQILTLSFSRPQYEQALEELRGRLIALKSEHPLLQLLPSTFYEHPEESALPAIWDQCVERAKSYCQARTVHREVFGSLEDRWLELKTPLGAVRLSSYALRSILVPRRRWDDVSKKVVAAYKRAAVLMFQTQEDPMQFVRTLDWAQICEHALPASYTDPQVELPVDASEEFKKAITAAWVDYR